MTTAELTVLRDAAYAAYLVALNSKSYTVNPGGGSGRAVAHQELTALHDKFLYWDNQLDKVKAGKSQGIPTKFITPTIS